MERDQIEELLNARVAPLLEVDGGTVEIVSFDTDTRRVVVRYGGSYRGAPVRDIVTEGIVKPLLQSLASSCEVGWVD